MPLMDPIQTHPTPESLLLEPNGQFRSTGEKLVTKSFKIAERHSIELDKTPYHNNGGVLVRILLDLYFKDQIPVAKMKFRQMLNKG